MSLPRAAYLKRLLNLYCGLPHTAARRPSRYDRQLAEPDATLRRQLCRLSGRSPTFCPLLRRSCNRGPTPATSIISEPRST